MGLFRRTAVTIMVFGALALAIGFGAGYAVSHASSAQASGQHGGIDIFPDGSLVACTVTLGCTSHPAGTCHADGGSDAWACSFALAAHTGGATVQDGDAECFFIQPSGSYFTSFNSHIVYAPSGQVNLRCAR